MSTLYIAPSTPFFTPSPHLPPPLPHLSLFFLPFLLIPFLLPFLISPSSSSPSLPPPLHPHLSLLPFLISPSSPIFPSSSSPYSSLISPSSPLPPPPLLPHLSLHLYLPTFSVALLCTPSVYSMDLGVTSFCSLLRLLQMSLHSSAFDMTLMPSYGNQNLPFLSLGNMWVHSMPWAMFRPLRGTASLAHVHQIFHLLS